MTVLIQPFVAVVNNVFTRQFALQDKNYTTITATIILSVYHDVAHEKKENVPISCLVTINVSLTQIANRLSAVVMDIVLMRMSAKLGEKQTVTHVIKTQNANRVISVYQINVEVKLLIYLYGCGQL
jgi:hypothetical protein